MIAAALTGFATGFSLILVIGAQNAFVLRQGLKREHVFWLCLFCAVSDALLITAGVAGFGLIVNQYPGLPRLMTVAGALFLFVYGGMRFYSAWRGGHSLQNGFEATSLGAVLAMAAAFTWLNPHVYLDTMGLLGAISTAYEGATRISFGLGAVLASFVFFFGLGYGARLLSPIMTSATAWRWLDIGVGVLMWWLAGVLYF